MTGVIIFCDSGRCSGHIDHIRRNQGGASIGDAGDRASRPFFHSVLSPGLNFIIPFVDRPKTIYTRKVERLATGHYMARTVATTVIDLREQVYDFPSQQVITRDNVSTGINASSIFRSPIRRRPSMR